MLRDVYHIFNAKHYTPERYGWVLEEIHRQAGETFMRMCETPVFVSPAFAQEVIQGATEIIKQTLSSKLKECLEMAVPLEFVMPSAPARPTFFIVDFAVTKDGPRLIELQAFASNLMFIPVAAKIYKDLYELSDKCQHLLSEGTPVKNTILGGHDPKHVALVEINPWQQKSRRDFVVTQKFLGIPVLDIREVIKKGEQLYYKNEAGQEVRINRIYNRVVPDEFTKLEFSKKTQFQFTDNLDVEWAGDPSWFLRVSKYAMPFLKHPLVPETRFLNEVTDYPRDLENYVLKPTSSNGGTDVKINVTKEDIDAVPEAQRHQHILMRKVNYEPFIPDLNGELRNAEVRIMFVWPDKLQPVSMSARVMRGNNVNDDIWGDEPWCGLTPVFVYKG